MISFVVALVLLGFALLGLLLRKTYYYIPAKELKRQAAKSAGLPRVLYRAVAFGPSLSILLWAWIGLTAAAGFVLLARIAPPVLGFVAVVLLLWFAFAWIPSTKLTAAGAHIAVWVNPAVVWLLGYVHRPFNAAYSLVRRRFPLTAHTGLYERDDLLDLLARQEEQPDSRVTADELTLVRRVLAFGDKKVREVFVPRKQVVSVKLGDSIGPVLLEELHASGYSYFPVFRDESDEITGAVSLQDLLAAKEGGTVEQVAHHQVAYIHENDTLRDALQAFNQAKQHLLLVVNSHNEYVGIVFLEAVLQELTGAALPDQSFHPEDRVAMASRHDKSKNIHKTAAETVSEKAGEVVE